MKKLNDMLEFSNNKGITLISLTITIVVMIILASVSINIGLDSLNDTMLEGFYMQMELVQKRVDDITTTNESYIDVEKNNISISLKETGTDLTSEQKESLNNILVAEDFSSEVITSIIDNFKYFTIQDLENILDIKEIDYNVFINFENRIVVAETGITIDKITYYMLKDKSNFVGMNTNKNVGTIESLIYGEPIKYTNDTYKVTITPSNIIGDLNGSSIIKYKKSISKYWEITNEAYVVVEKDIEYNIIYIDSNNNSIERTIKVEDKKDETGNLIQDEEKNNILIVTEVAREESEEV